MAEPIDTVIQLKADAILGELPNASREKLEQYAASLCQSKIDHILAGDQFVQVCELVRLQLLRQYINDAEKRASRYQWLVIGLAVASLISSIVQIGASLETSSQLNTESQPSSIMQQKPLSNSPSENQEKIP